MGKQIVVEELVFKLINGHLGFVSQFVESKPDQNGGANVVSLRAVFAALAFGDAGQLLFFSMKLLNFPTLCAFEAGSSCTGLSAIVCDDMLRAIGRDRYPKQFHLGVHWEGMEFDGFARLQVLLRLLECADLDVGLFAA